MSNVKEKLETILRKKAEEATRDITVLYIILDVESVPLSLIIRYCDGHTYRLEYTVDM